MMPADVPDHVDIVADLANGAQATYEFSAVTGLGPGLAPGFLAVPAPCIMTTPAASSWAANAATKRCRKLPLRRKKRVAGAWKTSSSAPSAVRKPFASQTLPPVCSTWNLPRPCPAVPRQGRPCRSPWRSSGARISVEYASPGWQGCASSASPWPCAQSWTTGYMTGCSGRSGDTRFLPVSGATPQFTASRQTGTDHRLAECGYALAAQESTPSERCVASLSR